MRECLMIKEIRVPELGHPVKADSDRNKLAFPSVTSRDASDAAYLS